MNPAFLLGHFERVADAPDAIPRLRRFILDLAIRGKLVEQDPADEPASELLKRIAAEKARLLEAGELKPRSIRSREHVIDFETAVPRGWEFARLGDISL